MSDVISPVEIEARIQGIARRIHEGVSVVSMREFHFCCPDNCELKPDAPQPPQWWGQL